LFYLSQFVDKKKTNVDAKNEIDKNDNQTHYISSKNAKFAPFLQ